MSKDYEIIPMKKETFPSYNRKPYSEYKKNKIISDFIDECHENIDMEVVESFGEEWSKFSHFDDKEIYQIGNEYFDILPPSILNSNSLVLDMGCGTGRWTKYLSPKVGFIDAVDPSKAIFVADNLLKSCSNVRLSKASSDNLPFDNDCFDLVISVGVLHHIPNTLKAMKDCVSKVKGGGYFYTYLYYKLDNRGFFFKLLFSVVDIIRKQVARLPTMIKKVTCDLLAVLFYMPFILLSRIFYYFGFKKFSNKLPLSYYRDKSFIIIRNDALDRFGTSLEQRFSRDEVEKMMKESGLKNIEFSEKAPFWHVIGQKI
jgi:SAM-dependent methyltransferase